MNELVDDRLQFVETLYSYELPHAYAVLGCYLGAEVVTALAYYRGEVEQISCRQHIRYSEIQGRSLHVFQEILLVSVLTISGY